MDVLMVTHFLNGALMVAMPLALAYFLTRKFKLGWRLWWIGAATFIISQVGHLPFNAGLNWLLQQPGFPKPPENWQLIFTAVVYGLSAGLWEELANYFVLRGWAREARSWRTGLLFGAGHGGIEAIILGGLVFLTFANMVILRQADLSTIVPAEQLELAQAQMAQYWSLPWYASLVGALERIFAMVFHLSAALLVVQTFVRRQWFWVWLAVLWHALLDGIAVFAAGTWGVYAAEGALAGTALISLAIIFALRRPEPEPPAAEAPAEPQTPIRLQPVEEAPEEVAQKIADSRYNNVP